MASFAYVALSILLDILSYKYSLCLDLVII